MNAPLTGTVCRVGPDMNTDVIIPARFMQDYDNLGAHVFAGESDALTARANASGFIVAGKNFGCGSSREQAVMAIKQAGIKAVIAPSFARIFLRNAVNLALPIVEADVDVADGATLEVDMATGRIHAPETGARWQARPLAPGVRAILDDGGLIEHMKKRFARDAKE